MFKGNWECKISIFMICGLILLTDSVEACGPGRAGGRRLLNRMRKYPPLVQRQYIPNVSENTFGASGAPEGPIRRHDQRFKELVQNWNPDIEFRDDERTGADRMMSQRLKEKLSVLAISVMNQWPNVRLRVIEGWDEDRRHSANSLHYEGRAVDITTSDKDRSKYGMLARLAVEAGFDWVHYESRSHVHCSVKSEKADSMRNNGCFDGASLVETPMGQMEMSQLQTNDLVLTMNSQTGELQFSPVLMWLDRDEVNEELYVNLTTKSGKQIRLTSSHLIYLADEPLPPSAKQAANSANVDLSNSNHYNNNNNNKANSTNLPRVNEHLNGGNNYYYDVIGNGNDATRSQRISLSDVRPTRANPQPASSTSKMSSSIQLDAQATTNSFDSSSGSSSNSRVEAIGDYIYTTYARNAVVGQYLLVHEPDEQLKIVVDSPSYESRSSGPNRLLFSSEQDSELKQESNRNRRYKFDRRQSKTIKTKVMFDEIVSVNYVSKQGIYAPLTRDGNIVVNSVVASCYALISDHDMAHWSMAPVRWLSYLNERLFGLRPETPTYVRTVDYIKREGLVEMRQQTLDPQRQDGSQSRSDHNTTNSLDRTKATDRHIHWYPILLYNIARFVLPNNYLY